MQCKRDANLATQSEGYFDRSENLNRFIQRQNDFTLQSIIPVHPEVSGICREGHGAI